MRKRILMGMAAMFTVVAGFGAEAAAPLHEQNQIVQLTSDPWFMAELSQATRSLRSEDREVVIEAFRALQEYMDRNATGVRTYLVQPGMALAAIPQRIRANLVEGFFLELASADDNGKVELLLAIAGCQPENHPVEENVSETARHITQFMRHMGILSRAGFTSPVEEDELFFVPQNVAYERRLEVAEAFEILDAGERVMDAISSAEMIHEDRRTGITEMESIMNADVTTRYLMHMNHSYVERVDAIRVWSRYGVLIGDEVRREKALCDFLAAIGSINGSGGRRLLFNRDLGIRTITVRKAYESYRTIIWSAKRCYKLARLDTTNNRRETENLMIVAILILRERGGFEPYATLELHESGRCYPPLPDRSELCRVFEDMRRLFIED
ncbi:MAG: hypothetical protein LBT03_00485 [Holosporales bacterium]|jgi:hypothetical protein|nr:hypothetical protein [Holosporales bacterium]